MKQTKIFATLLLAAALASGCGLRDRQAIIKINNKIISQAQYDDLMKKSIQMSPFAQMGVDKILKEKDGFIYLMAEQRVINQLMVKELLDQEAQARGVKVKKADVDEAVKKVMEKMGGKDNLLAVLKQNGVSIKEFKKDIEEQVKMEKLALAAAKIKITDKDTKAFYDKNKDKFVEPEQVRASHILIAANPEVIREELTSNKKANLNEATLNQKVSSILEQKLELAEKIQKELKANNSKFAAYAKKYSEDPNSAKQGGDLGFFPKDRMVPEFSAVAFTLKPNTVSEIVKTPYGYHIIMVTDRKTGGVVPYEKVKSDIKEYLTQEQEIRTLDELTQTARKKAKITFADQRYNPEVINKKIRKGMDDLSGGQASKAREQKK